MASLTIKNVPEPLLQTLRSRAAAHRRSLNSEVLACLEAVAVPAPVDPEALLAQIRGGRVTPKRALTDRMITRFKRAGRP